VSETIAGWVLYVGIMSLITVAIVAVTLIALTEAEQWWRRLR
jgi:hypothetical protein